MQGKIAGETANTIDITEIHAKGMSLKALCELMSEHENTILVDYPMSHINSTQSYLDILHNYIEASYIAETLGNLATRITHITIARHPRCPISRFELVTENVMTVAEKILQLSVPLGEEQDDEEILVEHQGELNEYAKSLEDREFFCPDLIDDYYANLVNGAYHEIEAEYGNDFLDNEFSRYPEREFGFWKSPQSRKLGYDVYASVDGWLVPQGVDLRTLLSNFSEGLSDEVYEEAFLFSVDRYSYIASSESIAYFPFGPYLKAQKCIAVLKTKNYVFAEMLENELLTYKPSDDYMAERYGYHVRGGLPKTNYRLSRSGFTLIIDLEDFSYAFLAQEVRSNNLVELYQKISDLFAVIGVHSGVTSDVSLPWDTLDDEKFENLCYDILYHHPKFDNSTIRKMGKSRSRDGGRDITVFSKEMPGEPSIFYIFQCKFTKADSSLSTQKLGNISDTIIQYNAHGYGVMTPTVIDSALYDRLDAICQRFNIIGHHWSGLEIERFLAKHPQLKDRHFANVAN